MMCTTEKKTGRLDDYREYMPLSAEETSEELTELENLFAQFAKENNFDTTQIDYNKKSLIEIIHRVDKRKVYSKVFYGCEISERNQAAILCYWILKFLPFYNRQDGRNVNIWFAVFLFLRAVTYAGKDIEQITCLRKNQQYLKDLFYAFQYRHLSKEAIMAIAETFAA